MSRSIMTFVCRLRLPISSSSRLISPRNFLFSLSRDSFSVSSFSRSAHSWAFSACSFSNWKYSKYTPKQYLFSMNNLPVCQNCPTTSEWHALRNRWKYKSPQCHQHKADEKDHMISAMVPYWTFKLYEGMVPEQNPAELQREQESRQIRKKERSHSKGHTYIKNGSLWVRSLAAGQNCGKHSQSLVSFLLQSKTYLSETAFYIKDCLHVLWTDLLYIDLTGFVLLCHPLVDVLRSRPGVATLQWVPEPHTRMLVAKTLLLLWPVLIRPQIKRGHNDYFTSAN